jgi:c-di-GMP-binding flagellar brake protein YcgR
MKIDERRKTCRSAISFPVECGLLPEKNYFYTVSKDLSNGGAKIIIDNFIPKGNVIRMYINIIDRVVEMKARVAWCNKERISDRYTAGLEFLEVNKTQSGALSQLLNTIQ